MFSSADIADETEGAPAVSDPRNAGYVSNWTRALCLNRTGAGKAKARPKAGQGSFDVSIVCHEVRGVELAVGEQVYVSVQDLHLRESKIFPQMGEVCSFKALELDTTLHVCVWLDGVSSSAVSPSAGERRVLGEVRLPMRHLISNYSSCLYYTWIMLETPGLHDSVSSLGFVANDEGMALDQAIAQGPRQLSQPRVCMSVCRSPDVAGGNTPSDRIMWTADATPESRISWWGPLLRSQQQHVVLSAALHLKSNRQDAQQQQMGFTQVLSKPPVNQDSRVAELTDHNREQAEEIEQLKDDLESTRSQLRGAQSQLRESHQREQRQAAQQAQLLAQANEGLPFAQQEAQAQLQDQSRRLADLEAKLVETEAREREAERRLRSAVAEMEELKARCEQKEAESSNLSCELDRISNEANEKIESANDRIRKLKHRREEADQELQELKLSSIPKLRDEVKALENENAQLAEQKEALLCIVDDLNKTCQAAGLDATGRRSIDNTLRNLGGPQALMSRDLDLSFS